MTTLSDETRPCFVCGRAVTYGAVVSTSSFGGARDLDFRPPPMMRSTVGLAVKTCPDCGYCADDIATGPENAAALVRAEEYVHQRHDAAYLDKANQFLCQALILEATGDLLGASWAATRAAWIGDDARAGEAAANCRIRALDLFLRARDGASPAEEQQGSQFALLADLARRAGLFAEARTLCRQGLATAPGEFLSRVFAFQLGLSERRDQGCYRTSDVPQRE